MNALVFSADIDECADGKHGCAEGQECVNGDGSFECAKKECDKGLELDEESGDCKGERWVMDASFLNR